MIMIDQLEQSSVSMESPASTARSTRQDPPPSADANVNGRCPPSRRSSTAAPIKSSRVALILLLAPAASASPAFLPRMRPRTDFGTQLSHVRTDRSRPRAKTDGTNGLASTRMLLRGGEDSDEGEDADEGAEAGEGEFGSSEASAPVEDVAVRESPTDVDVTGLSEIEMSGDSGKETSADDDATEYTTIGVLTVSAKGADGIVLIGYNCADYPDRPTIEKWSLRDDTTIPNDGNDAKDLRLAGTIGCVCHVIVIDLPKQLFESGVIGSSSEGAKHLDDALLCVAEGMIRRLKGTQQINLLLSVTSEDDYGVDDAAKESATRYIRKYLEHALQHAWERNFAITLGSDRAVDESSISGQCNIVVNYSASSATETATDIAGSLLGQDPPYDASEYVIVPRPLFGTLCRHIHKEMGNSLPSQNGSNDEMSAKRTKDPEESVAAESVANVVGGDNRAEGDEMAISANLRSKAKSVMEAALIDAERRLLEMENTMDEELLDGMEDGNAGNPPMPDFGRDCDAVIDATSTPFVVLMDEAEPMAEADRAWLRDQRVHALKQVAGRTINRLFHLHLQRLRDYYGQWYESMVESPLSDALGTGGYSSNDAEKNSRRVRSQEASRRAEEEFMKAAFGSIPQICQHPDGELSNDLAGMFSCVEALSGLLEDMYDVSSTHAMEEEEWDCIMDVNSDDADDAKLPVSSNSRVGLRQLIKNAKAKFRRRGPARWYERLALKLLVIGVNYVQGWIVLQSMRKEARKRDQDMPKFPLF